MNPSQIALRGAFSILLPKTKMRSMSLFLSILIMVITGSVVSFVIVRSVRDGEFSNDKIRNTLVVMIASMMLVSCDFMCCGGSVEYRIPFDLTISLLPLLAVSFSFWEQDLSLKVVLCMMLPMVLVAIWYIFQGIGVLPHIKDMHYIALTGIGGILSCLVFVSALFMRMMQVKLVLRDGNAWESVCMMFDMLYLLVMLLAVIVFLVSAPISTPI